ncbi:MAG: RluA family pseudouridine synthase [Treponema sp.]|nr:RluA family pseudouridine synthase [Treponema sp.]
MKTIPIIYENNEILVINKPFGLSCQGGQGVVHSLDEDLSKELGYKIFLVHRLDKDTSGLMIVAKDSKSASKWTKLISSKQVKKEYNALCVGKINPVKGVIEEEIFQHGESKNAITKYEVIKSWQKDFIVDLNKTVLNFFQIKLELETGRMHQIRIHLSKMGCPIIGDDQHGNFKVNKIIKKELKIKQLMLSSIKITLPIDGVNREFSIDIPDYMKICSI